TRQPRLQMPAQSVFVDVAGADDGSEDLRTLSGLGRGTRVYAGHRNPAGANAGPGLDGEFDFACVDSHPLQLELAVLPAEQQQPAVGAAQREVAGEKGALACEGGQGTETSSGRFGIVEIAFG